MSTAASAASTREHLLGELLACLCEVASRPSTAADRLLAEACRRVKAIGGRLLVLSAETAQLEVIAEHRVGHGAPPFPDRPVYAGDLGVDVRVEPRAGGVLVTAPALRGDVVVGLLEVLALDVDNEQLALLTTIAGLVPLVRSNLMFSAGLQLVPPIPDVSGDEASFRRRVYEYLDSHTQAALVCVYLVDEDLDVSLVFGPPATSGRRTFLTDPATFERLGEAALDHTRSVTVERNPVQGEPEPAIRSYLVVACSPDRHDEPGTADVAESYAMLVGFPMSYSPCEAEIAVFRQLLALAAYLDQVYAHLHHIADSVGAVAEIGSAITGLEVSQKARHEAKNQIELAQDLIAQITGGSAAHRELLEQVGLALRQVADDLDEMKRSTKAPDRKQVATSLKEVWETACSQVRFRMARRRIKLHYDGPDVSVIVAPDWFRQVFLNLLLNSADAFDAADRRHGRITLRVQAPSAGAERVEMSYADDASGILPQHFLQCDVSTDVPLHERIFRAGVTSKAGGSGWGLYVCRSIVGVHGGSIDLEHTRSGTAFRITIPKDPAHDRAR